jgi:hypothetical protein
MSQHDQQGEQGQTAFDSVKSYDLWAAPEGIRLKEAHRSADRDSLPDGCSKGSFNATDVQRIRNICDTIVKNVEPVAWGDGLVDAKKRCYGQLVSGQSNWNSAEQLHREGIVFWAEGEDTSKHEHVRRAATPKDEQTRERAFVTVRATGRQVTDVCALTALFTYIM